MKTIFTVLLLGCAALAQSAPDANARPPTQRYPTRKEQVVVTGSYGAVPLEETDRSVERHRSGPVSVGVPQLCGCAGAGLLARRAATGSGNGGRRFHPRHEL